MGRADTVALLEDLMDSPELREEFMRDPEQVIQRRGLTEADVAAFQQMDMEGLDGPLRERLSKGPICSY